MLKRILVFSMLAVAVPLAGFSIGSVAMRLFSMSSEPPVFRQGDFSAIVQSVGSPVVLLSTSTCPWCEKSRQWLRARKISYRDCVADEDAYAAELLKLTGVGTVPQLVNAHGIASSYDLKAFERIVNEATAVNAESLRCDDPLHAVAERGSAAASANGNPELSNRATPAIGLAPEATRGATD